MIPLSMVLLEMLGLDLQGLSVRWHGIINFSKKDSEKMMTITRFASVLEWQLIHNASTLTQSASVSRFACFNTSDVNCPLVSVSIPPNSKCSSLSCAVGVIIFNDNIEL